MKSLDFLIIGAGFSGSVIANQLHLTGKRILVIEKRDKIGGNCNDDYDQYGILIHQYGPHYFRTNNQKVFDYVSKFTKWRPYEYKIRTCVNGNLFPFPINLDTINKFFNVNLKNKKEVIAFLNRKKIPIDDPQNAEEQVLANFGPELYEAFFKNYTIKQWKTNPKNLDRSVTARIPIRYDRNEKYFNERIQAMPRDGYHVLFENLLDGIDVRLNTDYKDIKNEINYKNLIYTGPIDEFFDYKHGNLPYRSLKFEFEHYEQEFYQDWVQVNYPNDHEYTRIVEIKHATGQKIDSTTIVKEYPADEGPRFYPIPSPEIRAIVQKYQEEIDQLENTYFIGRLATYRYLNMDQVVAEALELAEKLKDK